MNKLLTELPNWMKSFPPLSAGIAATWLVVAVVVQLGHAPLLREASEAHYQAARLSAREPLIAVDDTQLKVVRAVDPKFENDTVLEFMRLKSDTKTIGLLQASFDKVAATAATSLERHPFRTSGLVPANGFTAAFATHSWMHSGFVHLSASLLLLLLVAPLLEQRWGTLVFALNSTLIVLGSAVAYMLSHPDSERPLVGGSALLAGLVAASLMQYRDDEIDFLAWLSLPTRLELVAPAWVLGPVWLVYEASLWVIAQGALPRGADNAVGYSAHAAGLLLGGGLALLVGKFGAEKAPATSTPAGHKTRKATRFDLEKVLALKAADDADTAYSLLETEVQRSARNRDVVMAYWEMAIEREETEQAAAVLVRLIEEELRRGANAVAALHWKTLEEHAPKILLDAPTLIRLAPAIGKEHGEEGIARALRQALDEENRGLTPALAANVARMAAEIDTRLAAEAAKRAGSAEDLDDKTRSEMRMLGAALAPSRPGDDKPTKKAAPAPSAFFEESDRSAFGDVGDLSELADDSFPDGAITEALPVALTPQGLTIDLEDRDQRTIEFTRMRAVAIVGVHGMGPKPIVLMDLLIDGGGCPEPLTLLRLRCDRFDARTLFPEAASSKDALREFVQQLRRQGLRVLANISMPSPDGPPVFESVDAYHEKIVRPIAAEFA